MAAEMHLDGRSIHNKESLSMSEHSFVSLTQDVGHIKVYRADHIGKVVVDLGRAQVYLLPADARTLLTQLSAAVLHSEPCEKLLAEWRTHPQDTFEYRLAEFAVAHTDDEIRAELITYLDEDPADSAPVVCARLLWPTLAVTA